MYTVQHCTTLLLIFIIDLIQNEFWSYLTKYFTSIRNYWHISTILFINSNKFHFTHAEINFIIIICKNLFNIMHYACAPCITIASTINARCDGRLAVGLRSTRSLVFSWTKLGSAWKVDGLAGFNDVFFYILK